MLKSCSMKRSLRKHDELREVFDAFQQMIKDLQAARAQDIEEIDRALEQARTAGVSDETLARLRAVRERLQNSLG